VKAVPSIAKKNDASSEVGANKDVIVSSSTSSEAADKESDSAVEMEVNAVVAESTNANKLQSEFESSSLIEDVKSESLDDDKYIPYSNAPSNSSRILA
jgi:hypothetical protein